MYEIFEDLLEKNNITAYKVGKETGIASSTFTDWKRGRSVPKQDKLQKIADFFNVTIDYLMGNEINTTTDSSKRRFEALVNEYNSGAIEILSRLCKNQRIDMDLTEKYVASKSNIPLNTYLSFENQYQNIGVDNMINILSFFDYDIGYITGFLTGALVKVNNHEDTQLVLDRLLLDEELKKDVMRLLEDEAYLIDSANIKNDITSKDLAAFKKVLALMKQK